MQTFEQYLAGSGQQSTADALRKSGGYGAAEAQYNATGGMGGNSSSGGNSGMPSVTDVAKQLQDFQIQANQPAIATLKASQQPLTDRYNALLDSIKGQGSVAQNAQTLASNNVLGKRGILPSSSLYQQTAASDLLPVTTQYAGLTAQTGLQQQQDMQAIQNQIASLQAGNSGNSIQGATGYLQSLQNAANIAAQNKTALQQSAIQYQNIPIGQYGNLNQATGQITNPSGGNTFTTSTGGFTSSARPSSQPAKPATLPPLTSFISGGAGNAAPTQSSLSLGGVQPSPLNLNGKKLDLSGGNGNVNTDIKF